MRALPLLAVTLLTLTSCATTPIVLPAPPVAPPVAPTPSPRPVTPAPKPAPAPAPAPLPADWQDWPFTPGDWRYGAQTHGSAAIFSRPGGQATSESEVIFSCDGGRIIVGRAGKVAGTVQMVIQTSFGTLSWPAENASGTTAIVAATRSPDDPGLDQIAFSRGRFTIELPGIAPLVLRPWAEISRVIEDCRRDGSATR